MTGGRLAGDSHGRIDTFPFEGRRGPQRKVTAESIYERALAVIDSDGVSALTARRLAVDIRISTRTLYKCVEGHDDLIQHVIALHGDRLKTGLQVMDSWAETVVAWCMSLYRQMAEHPNASARLTQSDFDGLLRPKLHRPVECAAAFGIDDSWARQDCRLVVQTAFNAAVVSARCGSSETLQSRADDVRRVLRMMTSRQHSSESVRSSCT